MGRPDRAIGVAMVQANYQLLRGRSSTCSVVLATALALALFTTACSQSPTDALIARSAVHLEAAAQILEDEAPNQVALAMAVMDYRHERRSELIQLRKDGNAVIATLDKAGRKRLATESRARTLPVITRIDNLVRRYPKPRRARVTVQSLVMQATPRPRPATGTTRPWAPKLPPFSPNAASKSAPEPATPTF